jgi:PAS domain S-box-containing protein
MFDHQVFGNLDFEFRLLFELIPNGVVVVDGGGRICLANAEAEKLLGYFRNELIGRSVEILVPERFRSEHIAMRHMFDTSLEKRAMGGGRALFARARDGSEIPVAIALRPFQFRGHSLVLASIVDITERTTIMRELAHRSKNLLAIVMAVAHQTINESADMAVFKRSFEGRLEALAQSMELLIDQKWLGIPLDDLVQVQMKPFAGAADRIVSDGPPIMLRPEFAQRLGLVLHELATNAVKYGALSAPEGKVFIRWQFDDTGDRKLKMTWTEKDGPRVTPPVRTGFGHKLLSSLKKAGLCDDMELDFPPDGFRWCIECSEPEVMTVLDPRGGPIPAEVAFQLDDTGSNAAAVN